MSSDFAGGHTRAAWAACIVFSVLTLDGCGGTQPSTPAEGLAGPTVVATTRQIMLGITEPTSAAIFAVPMQEPQSDADWERVVASAMSLGESAKLMMEPPRVIDRKLWLDYSNNLLSEARIAAAAAQEKNLDKVVARSGPIYQTCVACHQKYAPVPPGR